MTNFTAEALTEAELSLVVIRCTCAPGQMNHPGEVCPNGREEDLGVVSYYNQKRLKRWSWAIRHKLGFAREHTLGNN